MASLVIRNLDEDLKRRLRVRAAEHGRSMESEARDILASSLSKPGREGPSKGFGTLVFELFGGAGNGVDLEVPPRLKGRAPPDFGE